MRRAEGTRIDFNARKPTALVPYIKSNPSSCSESTIVVGFSRSLIFLKLRERTPLTEVYSRRMGRDSFRMKPSRGTGLPILYAPEAPSWHGQL